MKVGDEITIAPAELVAGGEAMAKVEGFPIFVAGLYPGDVAVVRLAEVRKGFARGDMLRLATPSASRRLEPCPIADECGGCDWTALRLDKQLEAKRRILTESLRRIGKIDPAGLPSIAIHPSPLNYRLRSRLHSDPATGDVGFFAARSNRVVPLARECEIVGPQLLAHLDALRDLHGQEIDAWESGDRYHATASGEISMTISLAGFSYQLTSEVFFQINRHLLGTMLRLVTDHARKISRRKTAIDLYAGAGFFTLPLAALFERVISVEGSPASHRLARLNAQGLSNVELAGMSVEQFLQRMPKADLIFLDPPRGGARPEMIEAIGKRAIEAICYLSCDPVTFARDANRLIASGWRISTLDLLDLFPNTHHVETLSLFERAG
ncbi:MAG TPA: TRAM domain-containing protein [Thermoanaerobaculia bacterium]|nr:TRAM domain-containing protein [Thermoanaerobaculia bacterium]